MGLSWLPEGQDMDLGLGRGRKDGRTDEAPVGLLMWRVPTHSCMHLYSPQQHALYLSAQVSAVSQDLFSVWCVSTLLSGTETSALLLYFS
ncbi:hypothetical protein QQF64_017909 [Cirrhinus molitorella]|uniref:Uncharacterized protein n=1 Tax=Cirrhinus molitorella TaxID=172907 RepID=A0ABR3LMA6_9TELE